MEPFSIGVGFLVGVATGAAGTYFGNKYTDKRRAKESTSAQNSVFDKLWKNHNVLLSEMKSDMENPDFFHHRNFWMLDSNCVFNHDGPYLAYHLDKYDSLDQQLQILESYGVILDVSDPSKNVKKYQFAEHFVEHLRSKRKKWSA